MHTFNVTLRRKAYQISREAIVARRLKRLPTILDKLGSREKSMSLSRMQDIGGVRAIMPEVKDVYKLFNIYTQKGRFAHILKGTPHDHIAHPKPSGYRGIHLVFEFNNAQGRSSNARDYDGLNIEVQLRTKLQHEWGTAVETVGMLRHEELKSSRGNKQWLAFFRCMASVMASLENQPVLDEHRGTKPQDLYRQTTKLARQLDISNVMAGWLHGVSHIEEGSGYYYHILMVDVEERKVRVIGYEEKELKEANRQLALLEEAAAVRGTPEPVLVAAGDIKKLKRAYPNYFLDITDFLELTQLVAQVSDGEV